LRWSKTLPGQSVAVAVGYETVWRTTTTKLQRWRASEEEEPQLAAEINLPKETLNVVAQGGEALVLAREGVRVARPSAGGIALSAATSLCGRPLQATGLGEGQWLVATTLGHAVVSTREGGAPQVESGLVLLANQPAQGKGTAVVSPLTPPVLAVCKTLDALLPKGVVEGLQRTTALDASDAGHVVASWGSFAFWLDVSKPKEPQVNGVTLIPGWVHSFRVDDRGERVYGLRKLPNGSSEPLLLDARQGWRVVGTHEVAAWVERKEEGKLMARKRVGGQVDVAWRVR
jgi:hypothetical protein